MFKRREREREKKLNKYYFYVVVVRDFSLFLGDSKTHYTLVWCSHRQIAVSDDDKKTNMGGKEREREKFDDDNRVKNKNNNNSTKKFRFKQVKITLVYYMIQLFSKFQNNDLNK